MAILKIAPTMRHSMLRIFKKVNMLGFRVPFLKWVSVSERMHAAANDGGLLPNVLRQA